ncbi:acyl-CoA synthetase [Ponticoccus sp. SC2-23]|uniref:acyl-CoA synthetase n=1 Tax=Alexandriicola marinus TaxID=2081710 RepID=UPI000FD9F0A8|nr:acyl-CoA synthetase [Alexandriicola marinus]MBM1219883.1 acyl-CoA synthetase [Ponticoccus sp. SC6-9]MBM1224569.1 acyl-CoA synthetase [Ponticoccus sp. SC6-15]MBM1228082.1 acyl-CoA synthetase [Ponticoccus sp. SC6-38]MBM1234280.1 acyl-CoA synthetase [Ponticoccus sp. SC6-45]MBM1238584.1 acyl-CoA synthetase [Ponticoccus sp. SC6-49]MBM1242365.1 acyl-CoA synthetase [Ponticoccus sp. SC2-64]MBM1247804.1 acyl-CoA synthetase [Ponticoccus sp. SC6-42]MBM1251537.1 acyl-CoA synthetase [Ponticoccus sp. 
MTFSGVADRDAIEAEQPFAERDLPKTTWGMLSRTAERFGSRKAVTFQLFSDPGAKDETFTWSELQAKTAQTANLFRSLGVGERDVVAYLLPNCNETILTYLGGQVAGIVNPVNPLLDAEQIAAILRETGAKVLVTLRAFPKTDVAQKAAEAVKLAPNVETVLEVDLHRYLTGIKKLIVPLIRPKVTTRHQAKILNFNAEMAKQPKTLTFEDATADRPAAYFHTGGTTGMPKVAQHRFSGIVYNSWLGDRLLFTEKDVQICPLPMFHVFAAIVALGASLSSGAQIVFPTPQGYRGDGVFDNFWKLVERHKVTFMIAVPTAMSALMQRKVDADISTLKLAFCGSAPLPLELYKKFEKAAGVTICEGYGLTEATCLVSINPPEGEKRVGSIGIPFPHTHVRIIDPDKHVDLAVGEVGEICISNPGVASGDTYTEPDKNKDLYYHWPENDDWYLRTGDLGRLDEDGYLWITGRAKDLIIRGGHNIDPAEIEEALAGHPDVAFVGAIGQPDAHSGEIPCAYVELVDGATASTEELLSFAKDKIAERAAHPKYLEILPELPKTAVGKIFKPDLRRKAISRIYNEALKGAGVAAEVTEVFEDKKRGLVARLRKTGQAEDADVVRALGDYTRPWEWAA